MSFFSSFFLSGGVQPQNTYCPRGRNEKKKIIENCVPVFMQVMFEQMEDDLSGVFLVPVHLRRNRVLTACIFDDDDNDVDVYREEESSRRSRSTYRSTTCIEEHVRARVEKQEFREAELCAQKRHAIDHDAPFCVRRKSSFLTHTNLKSGAAYAPRGGAGNCNPDVALKPSCPTAAGELRGHGRKRHRDKVMLPHLDRKFLVQKNVSPASASTRRERSPGRLPPLSSGGVS
ncbi:hypothetical protein MOQ_000702 [Trypanosoma cruzi marinkellei]|uniref:Uncharacterized protein n=1 Tax=Trypanosoma cruzi marinkellei TaxID=85056 RepID=K2NI77_TRYCR|nr:hypothetical protein MOQ_000702 [Trypanosoma cruzi marinkellei]